MGEGMRIGSIEVHPAANLFPEMGDDDLDALARSIREHGLRNPLVFFEGRLLDGRNRVRAAVVAGLNTERLPRRNIDPDEDPYEWAWAANCARRDYTPIEKAAIRITVEEASGELRRVREEAEARANAARAEKAKGNDHAAKDRNGERSRDRSPSEPRPSGVAAEDRHIAEKAKVSVSTAKRARKLKEKDPETFAALAKGKLPKSHPLLAKRSKARNWNVPRSIPALASFLWERLPSTERLELARLLTEDAP